MPDDSTPRSRRALLAAAAGGAAALAAQAALPLTAMAADPNDVLLGARECLDGDDVDRATRPMASDGFAVSSTGLGIGVSGTSGGTAGVRGISVDGTSAASSADMAYTGAYGWSPAYPADDDFGVGVWGDSEEVGVYGSGRSVSTGTAKAASA